MADTPITLNRKSAYVLQLARHAAQELHHNVLGPEHLLFGLLHLGEGEGRNFNLCGLVNQSYIHVRRILEEFVLPGQQSYSSENRYHLVMRAAADHAAVYQRREIIPEDLVWGIVALPEPQCPAYGALRTLGVTCELLADRHDHDSKRGKE